MKVTFTFDGLTEEQVAQIKEYYNENLGWAFEEAWRNMGSACMKVEKNDVSSFFYYMWNKWCEDECKIVFADSCGGYKHYWNKWVHFCNEYGVRSAVDCLYGDLDTGNRDKLVARALECYDGMRELK